MDLFDHDVNVQNMKVHRSSVSMSCYIFIVSFWFYVFSPCRNLMIPTMTLLFCLNQCISFLGAYIIYPHVENLLT